MIATTKTDPFNIVDAATRPALARLFRRIGELSTLPVGAQRIMQVTSNESADAGDLLDVVEGDPVLAARVLRRVNSAFYGLRHTVEDLRSAISLLGIREIRNLALTVYMTRMFDSASEYRGFSRDGLWQHCVAVGQASRLVSRACRMGSADEAYLAGLLHDLGLILLDQFLPKYLMQVVDHVSQHAATCEAEQMILPFDHTQLGAYVAQQWRFPASVIAATRFHHDPLAAPPDQRTTTSIVAVANYLCHRADLTSLGTANTFAPPDAVFAELHLGEAQLAAIWDQFQDVVAAS